MPFEAIKLNILSRRTTKPEFMNGGTIDETEIRQLLELANWAPTHGHTEPWRFTVFSGKGIRKFCKFHADLYKREMDEQDKEPVKYRKILHRGDHVSHIIAIGMKRGDHPKVPEQEEHASAAIAAHNIWLGAASKGIACYWGSGGMTYHNEMRRFLGLGALDKVLGFLYLGYSDDPPRKGKRLSSIDEKVTWVSK